MSSPNHPLNQPSFEQLLDWLEGRLSAGEAEKMAVHMAQVDDAVIQAEAAWIQAFLQAKQTVVFEAPPPAVRQSLLQSFSAQIKPKVQPAPPVAAPPQSGFFQRLVGVLTFDSHGQFGLAGARGGAQPVARQLIYQGTVADVALNLHLDLQQQRFTLLGQCLPTGEGWPATAAVQLLQAEHEIAITMTDELGEFAYADLLPGEYQLIVSAEQCDIVISPLVLAL